MAREYASRDMLPTVNNLYRVSPTASGRLQGGIMHLYLYHDIRVGRISCYLVAARVRPEAHIQIVIIFLPNRVNMCLGTQKNLETC